MKKLISLLLVLVMTLGMLSGICLADEVYEMPAQATEANAGVMVTCSSDNGAKYYFETLTQELIFWACQNLKGVKTITLLKDLDLSSEGTKFLQIPGNLAQWEGKNGDGKLVIDLNEKTLSYKGTGHLFHMSRYGVAVKNGTIKYESETRNVFCLGGSKDATATSSGTVVWEPKLVLDNVEIYSNNSSSACVIWCGQYAAQIEITDSLLHTQKGVPVYAMKSSQENAKTVYEGDYETSLEIVGSTLISSSSYPIDNTTEAPIAITIEDSTLVSNHKSGNVLGGNTENIDAQGEEPVEENDWSLDTAVGTLTGKAYVFGDAATDEMLPFTDVAETDWFHDFVKELYNKKIVSGQTLTTFNPNGNLTYAAALKLLVVGLTGKDPGNASGGHWAANYLAEAKNAGWTDIDTAKLDSPITREAFCEIAAKAASLTEGPAVNPFTDTENASVLALVKAGVINGMSADKFAPTGILTRAQISKIISLLLKLK